MTIDEAEERLLTAYKAYSRNRTPIQIQIDAGERLAIIAQGFGGKWDNARAKIEVERIEFELGKIS